MGIYIQGMNLQKPQLTDGPSVYSAYILVETDGRVAIVVDNEDRLDSTEYSLVNVPPHGRLIDADDLFEKVYKAWGTEYDAGESNWFMDMINDAPTIIPAEEAQP